MESASPAPPTDCTVWIPAAAWPRIQPSFEAMNTAEAALPGLRIPAERVPVAVVRDGNGDVAYSCGQPSTAPAMVGESTGYSILGEPGWTMEKFTLLVMSRKHMHLDIADRKSPTLAALAGFWQTPLFVDTPQNDSHLVSLVTPGGKVASVECNGGPEGVARLRERFFAKGVDAALALPGVTLRRTGFRTPPGVQSLAARRQGLLHDWVTAHELGRMAVPRGAELTAQDFVFPHIDEMERARPLVARARSSRHLYELLFPVSEKLGPLELLCAVDGVLQRYLDPETGIERGFGALATDWADWILEDSVPEGHRAPKQPWEGNGIEARLYRLEHNIVDFADQETGTSQFGTALELETWLKGALGRHNLPFSVHILDDAALLLGADIMPVYQKHTYEQPRGKVLEIRRSGQFFSPWAGFGTWESSSGDGYVFAPRLSSVMDGGEMESYVAVNCLDYNQLAPYLLPAGAPVDANSWFLLNVGDTRTSILFPADASMVQVSTDHDGASAQITVREYWGRRRELDRERAFQAQWANWLEEEHQLTQDEIRAGLDTLDQLIKENSK